MDFDPGSTTVANQVVGVYFSWVEERWYTSLTQGATMATATIIIINRGNPPLAFPLYSKDVASISTCFFHALIILFSHEGWAHNSPWTTRGKPGLKWQKKWLNLLLNDFTNFIGARRTLKNTHIYALIVLFQTWNFFFVFTFEPFFHYDTNFSCALLVRHGFICIIYSITSL